MEKSKQTKTSDGVDMISNLPDHVLLSILSRIPTTEEVIQTSILSTRWRHLWTSVPSIDINCYRGLNPLKALDTIGFREFLYWILLNKPQDLDSFRLKCADFYNMLTIRQWIHAAVMRKVKLLDLMFCPKEETEDVELPHSLVTCGSLEVLKLCLLGSRLCLPNITGFQGLRVLELRELYLFLDDVIKYFLESCPLLEDLSVIDCLTHEYVVSSSRLKSLRIHTQQLDDGEGDHFDSGNCLSLEISCPKLEFLKLTGYVAIDFQFENLFSLKKDVIHVQDMFLFDAPSFDFFATISHVEYLSITVNCIQMCCQEGEVDTHVSLSNLKTLEIIVDWMNMGALIKFLTRLPHLESLHLIIPKEINNLPEWNLEVAATMSILTRHLKKVEFLKFDEEEPKLVVTRAFLEHAKELEEMVFIWSDEAKFHEMSMETMNKVSNFHKASSNVKLRCGVIEPIQIDSSLVSS